VPLLNYSQIVFFKILLITGISSSARDLLAGMCHEVESSFVKFHLLIYSLPYQYLIMLALRFTLTYCIIAY